MSNEELAVAYRQGDKAALLPLWTQVEKLAAVMVRPYIGLARKNRAVDFDDLMQSAFLAVERAAKAYREAEGGFSTVMGFYVKQEASALLGLRGRVRRELYEAVSADAPVREDSAATVGDTLTDDSLPDPDGGLLRDDVRREVHAAIDRLPEEQARVIHGQYLGGMTQGVLADEMGVAPSRVSQLRQSGMRKLRGDWRLRRLRDEALPLQYKGVRAFNQDWTSTVEQGVMVRERLRSWAVRRGVSEETLREWGFG